MKFRSGSNKLFVGNADIKKLIQIPQVMASSRRSSKEEIDVVDVYEDNVVNSAKYFIIDQY